MESDLPDAQLIEVVSQRCADRKLNETKRGSLRRRHRRFWPQIRRGTEFRGSIHDEPPEPPSSAMFFNYSTRHSLKTTRFTDTLLADQMNAQICGRRRSVIRQRRWQYSLSELLEVRLLPAGNVVASLLNGSLKIVETRSQIRRRQRLKW